jgi:dihydrofolate reductase
MAKVVTSATMSLDGFVADRDDGVAELFGWFNNGDVHIDTPLPGLSFDLTPESAEYWRGWTEGLGSLLVGRRLFDITNGWGGRHPLDVPVVVLSHSVPDGWPREDAPFEFYDDLEAAVARASEIAGDGTVGVAAGQVGIQVIDAGLADAVAIDLVPVVLGVGRPYFGHLANGPVRFGDPRVVEGRDVTHLVFERQV